MLGAPSWRASISLNGGWKFLKQDVADGAVVSDVGGGSR